MKPLSYLIATLLALLTSVPLPSQPLHYPLADCGFFADGAVDGIFIENPTAGFYGLFETDNTSAATWNINCLAARVSGSAMGVVQPLQSCGPFAAVVSASYFECGFKQQKNLDGLGMVQLFSISGGGIGGAIPDTQTNFFRFCRQETEVQALIASTYAWSNDVAFYIATGYGFMCHKQNFDSQLINFAQNGFNNGTIHESLETTYHGVDLELGLSKRFWERYVFTAVPFFSTSLASTEFSGFQDWGDLGLPPSLANELWDTIVVYRGGLRCAVFWQYCRYHIGARAFFDSISYVPGIFNPQEGNDGPARITMKSSLRYGGGLVVGCCY